MSNARGRSFRDNLPYEESPICPLCLMPMEKGGIKVLGRPTIDHIEAKSVGGTDRQSNLQITHARCNFVKGSHDMEWVENNRDKFLVVKVGKRKKRSLKKKYEAKGTHYIGLKGRALTKYIRLMTEYKIKEIESVTFSPPQET